MIDIFKSKKVGTPEYDQLKRESEAWQRGYNEAMQYMDENPSVLRAILKKVEEREGKTWSLKSSMGMDSRYAQNNRRM